MPAKRLLQGIAILFFVLAIGYPLVCLFRSAEIPPGEARALVRVTGFSLLQASLSVLGAFALGAPVGILVGRALGPSARATLLSLYSMPTLVVATTVLSFFHGKSWRFSLLSVVVAHSILNAPWIALQIAEGFRELPRAWTEMARTLGADTRALLRDFFVPFIRLNLLTAALQVFLLCWMSFTLVLLLGGGPPVSTLETEVFASFRMGELQTGRAAIYAVTELGIGLVPVILWARMSARKTRWASELRLDQRGEKSEGFAGAVWVLFLPYFFFMKNAFFLPSEAWRAVLSSAEFLAALGWSLVLGLETGFVTLALGLLFTFGARGSFLIRILANVPAAVSALVLCAGFFFAWAGPVELFTGGLHWIALLQAILLLPFAFRWIYQRMVLEDADRLSVARTLGAAPMRAFRDVELWKWTRVLYRVFGLAFVWSLGEYAVIAFFGGGGERELLPQYIARLYSRYAFDEAQVSAFVLFVLTWAVLRFMMSRGGKFDVA